MARQSMEKTRNNLKKFLDDHDQKDIMEEWSGLKLQELDDKAEKVLSDAKSEILREVNT